MATSPARIAANRRNALKSTGPRTPEGKERISQNAAKHGLTARTICLDEESSDGFYQLRRHMLQELDPQSEIECQLVEQMISARWRLTRLWEIETDLYNKEMESTPGPDHSPTPSAVRRRTLAFEKLGANGSLDRLSRYEGRISREFDRCHRRLAELQAARELRRREEAATRFRLPVPNPPIQHTDLLTADEYIRLQRKEKFVPSEPRQNKPKDPPAPGAPKAA